MKLRLTSRRNHSQGNCPESRARIAEHDEIGALAKIDEVLPLIVEGALIPSDRDSFLVQYDVSLEIKSIEAVVQSVHPYRPACAAKGWNS